MKGALDSDDLRLEVEQQNDAFPLGPPDGWNPERTFSTSSATAGLTGFSRRGRQILCLLCDSLAPLAAMRTLGGHGDPYPAVGTQPVLTSPPNLAVDSLLFEALVCGRSSRMLGRVRLAHSPWLNCATVVLSGCTTPACQPGAPYSFLWPHLGALDLTEFE